MTSWILIVGLKASMMGGFSLQPLGFQDKTSCESIGADIASAFSKDYTVTWKCVGYDRPATAAPAPRAPAAREPTQPK